MDVLGIQTQMATILKGVGGAVQTYTRQPSAIPQTPSIVIGQPHGSTATGGTQISAFVVPVRAYVIRSADEPRNLGVVGAFVNAVLAALAPYNENSVGGYWNVLEKIDWDSGKYYTVAGVEYAACDFDIVGTVIESVTTYGAH